MVKNGNYRNPNILVTKAIKNEYFTGDALSFKGELLKEDGELTIPGI